MLDVAYLSSDLLEGRGTGTKGEALARTYIAKRFQEIGLAPKGNNGKWFHAYSFKQKANPHEKEGTGPKITSNNVVGYLDNGAATTIIIGAHYDHLGWGGHGSLQPGDSAIHNGADDNASGTAGLFILAELLKKSNAKNNNYLFIAFSGEELGLYGSKSFADDPTIELSSVNYMMNMDMIGRLNDGHQLAVYGTGTSPVWEPLVSNIKMKRIEAVKTTASGVGPSDHTSFYLKDLPVLHFFTGPHRDYHKPSDDAHLIDYPGIYAVCKFMLQIIETVDGEGKIPFTKTKDEENKVSSFKVSLGVLPDYLYDGEGMRIDAVIEGRAAQKGGIEDGDVIIAIGEHKVKEIYSYMKALNQHEKGQQAVVKVKRGEEVLEKEVTF